MKAITILILGLSFVFSSVKAQRMQYQITGNWKVMNHRQLNFDQDSVQSKIVLERGQFGNVPDLFKFVEISIYEDNLIYTNTSREGFTDFRLYSPEANSMKYRLFVRRRRSLIEIGQGTKVYYKIKRKRRKMVWKLVEVGNFE